MSDVIRQAADVMAAAWLNPNADDIIDMWRHARVLADAGLLVTPQQRAVVDAADNWRNRREQLASNARLVAAVDAWRTASAGPDAGTTGP